MRTYTDPVSSLDGLRLTEDGASYWIQDISGEQAAGSPWAQDSRRICFSRGTGAGKPEGVYMMDITTGVMTLLVAVESFRAYPTWGLGEEVYFYEYSGGKVRVKAVHAGTLAVRTIFEADSNGERQKIGVSCLGTKLDAHIQPTGGGAYKTILARIDGSGILSNWGITGPNSGDGAYWHPTDDDLIIASRGTGGESGELWRASTATKVHERNFRLSHACVWGGAGGNFIYQIDSGNVVNLDDPDNPDEDISVPVDDGGQGAVHCRVLPQDWDLGLDARIIFDEAPFYYSDAQTPPAPRASLFLTTPNQCKGHGTNHWRAEGLEVGLHFSRSSSNAAHPHPSPSPDGRMILFGTDKKWYPTGFTLPGPAAAGSIDLCVLMLAADPEPPEPPDPVPPDEPNTVVIEYEADGVPFGTVTLTAGTHLLTQKVTVK